MIDVSTWQDVRDMVYALFSDSDTNQSWFTTAKLESWANQCLNEIAELAKPIDTVVTFNAVAGTALYEVNSAGHGTIEIVRVEVNGQKIMPVTQSMLYRSNRTWQAVQSEPKNYYCDGLQTSEDTGFVFGLWPTPTTTDSITVVIKAVPDAVDNDAMDTVVNLPLWAVPGLVWGIVALAYSSESKLQNMDAANLFNSMYMDMVERLKGRTFSRLQERLVYGEGKSQRRGPDWLGLLPPDGIPYP